MRTYKSFDEFKIYADEIARRYYFTILKYNEDYSVDISRDVWLQYKDLKEFPIQFNIIDGTFRCFNNKLTSLEGSPRYVTGSFFISHNELTSLEGGPKYVGGNFSCDDNKLISLKGAPEVIGYTWFIEEKYYSYPEYQKYLLVKKIEAL